MKRTPEERERDARELELLENLDDERYFSAVRILGDDGTPSGVALGTFLAESDREDYLQLCADGLCALTETNELRQSGRFSALHGRLTDKGVSHLRTLRGEASRRVSVAKSKAKAQATRAAAKAEGRQDAEATV